MKTEYLPTLIIAFVIPIIYQRVHFELRQKDFFYTPLRTKTNLNIHHASYGFVMFVIAAGMWFCDLVNHWSAFIGGCGFGLVIDEFIALLFMPGNDRVLELQVYRRSRNPTIILATFITVFLLVVFVIKHFHLL